MQARLYNEATAPVDLREKKNKLERREYCGGNNGFYFTCIFQQLNRSSFGRQHQVQGM